MGHIARGWVGSDKTVSFDATEFLQGLFGGDPPTVAKPAGHEPTAEVFGEESITKVSEEMARKASEAVTTVANEMVTVANKSEMETPATDSTLAASGFAGWIRRPDATGRLGWESPESPRCWGGSTFEDLLEPPPACDECGSLELWETLAGTWRCLHCDPPTTAIRLLEQAAAIRRREGKPDPPGAAGFAVEWLKGEESSSGA